MEGDQDLWLTTESSFSECVFDRVQFFAGDPLFGFVPYPPLRDYPHSEMVALYMVFQKDVHIMSGGAGGGDSYHVPDDI